MSVRWLVRKSSIQQTSLTDDFVWTGWGVRFTPPISTVFTIDTTNALRTTRFRSSLIPKKHFTKKEAFQKRSTYSCHFQTGQRRLAILVVSQLLPLPISTTNLDSQSAMSCTSGSIPVRVWRCRSTTKRQHEQALSSEPEHRASELEKCDSWFSTRNDRYPATHHSKCIPIEKKNGELMRARTTSPMVCSDLACPPQCDEEKKLCQVSCRAIVMVQR